MFSKPTFAAGELSPNLVVRSTWGQADDFQQRQASNHERWRLWGGPVVPQRNRQQAHAIAVAGQFAPAQEWGHLLSLECGGYDHGWGVEADDLGAPLFPCYAPFSWGRLSMLEAYGMAHDVAEAIEDSRWLQSARAPEPNTQSTEEF